VHSGERPTLGRRKAMAQELSLPEQEVILAVREWSYSEMNKLSRKQLFEIEKEYWHLVEEGAKAKNIPVLITDRVKFATLEQVERWIDQLNDDTKLKNVALPSEEKVKMI